MFFDQPDKKKANGVVYTPQSIATEIVRFLKVEGVKTNRILEPSVGDGAFVAALSESGIGLNSLVAIDIDEGAIAKLELAYPNASFIAEDFLAFCEDSKPQVYDLVIGNPPYIRLRTFTSEFRRRVDRLSERTGYPRQALKNAWAAFSVAAEQCLAEDGTLAFVVPYEMMHVGYGVTLQHELFPKFARVDIFIPDTKAFKAIDQDAVLFVARKMSKESAGVFVSRIESLENINVTATVKIDYTDNLNLSENLKSFLLTNELLEAIKSRKSKCKTIGDLSKSMAGIVTAANDYFILHHKDVNAHDLGNWGRPILKKSAYLTLAPVISDEVFSQIKEIHPSYLLDFNSINQDDIPPAVKNYLKIGKAKGVDQTYKSRHRKPWFKVPIVPPSPAFFFKRSHSIPRLCVNEAGVYVTDTAYQIEPNPGYSAKGLCFSFYNSLSLLFAEIQGRFYGGGVLELTPNEFRRVPIIYTEPTDEDFDSFATLATSGDVEALANFGDSILINRHNISSEELALFRSAWTILREHRLRHGVTN